MTKKLLVALVLAGTALLGTNSFGQCSSGVLAQFVAAGSSAQFNTFAYAAVKGLGLPNFWTTTSAQLQDTRFSPAATDTGLTAWVAWDNNAVCNAYIYYNTDSGIGIKNFFAYAKQTTPVARIYGAVYGLDPGTNWESAAGVNAVPGIADTGTLPANLASFLVSSPAPTTATQTPQPGCGQAGALAATTFFCYFNAGMTDIRPEDALFATTRALSAYSTTNGLAGLGYAQTGCGAANANHGCQLHDAFSQGKLFNVLNFKLSGTDPVTTAAVPVYTTLATGAAPVMVMVSNHDTGAEGLGSTSGSNYVFQNINRPTLASVFNGTSQCAGDILPTSAPSGGGSGPALNVIVREPLSGTYNTFEYGAIRTLTGSAATAVKQSTVATTAWISNDDSGQELDLFGNLTTGPATNYSTDGTGACGYNKGVTGVTGAEACGDPLYNPGPSGVCASGTYYKARAIGTGEEVSATRSSFNGGAGVGLTVNDGIGYAFWSYQNFSGTVASTSCNTTVANGDVSCTSFNSHYLTVDGVDPLFNSPGGSYPPTLSATTIENPTGAYDFPQCDAVLTKNNAKFPCQQLPFTHILDGSYPVWSLLRLATFSTVAATPTGDQSVLKQATPAGVINMVAAAESEAVDSSFLLSDFVPLLSGVSAAAYTQGAGAVTNTAVSGGTSTVTLVQGAFNPSDPFSTSWTGSINIAGDYCTIASVTSTTQLVVDSPCVNSAGTSVALPVHAAAVPYLWDGGSFPTGNLNLGVFRSHFAQSLVNPQNGHKGCTSGFSGVNITGGKSGQATCLVDVGGDEGGSILTVQADVDFNATDFGGITAGKKPAEIYGLHQ
jgi:hypothetical protein